MMAPTLAGAGLMLGDGQISAAERNSRQSASLSKADDQSALTLDIGAQLRGVVFRRATNAGNVELLCNLVNTAGGEFIPLGTVNDLFLAWRFAIIRYQLDARQTWTGRLVDIRYRKATDPSTGAVSARAIRLRFEGLSRILTDRAAALPSEFTGDDAKVSASDVALYVVQQLAGTIVSNTTDHIAPTSVNIGPIGVTGDQTPHDVLVNALAPGGSDASGYWYGIFEPEDGVWVQALQRAVPDYMAEITDRDVDVVWNGENYSWRQWVTYSDENGTSQKTSEPAEDARAKLLHNGVEREGNTALSRIPESGAHAAAATELERRSDPVGFDGQLVFAPRPGEFWGQVMTAEGREIAAFEVQPGAIFWLRDAPGPSLVQTDEHDPQRLVAVVSTEWATETGTLSAVLDPAAIIVSRNSDSGLSSEARRQFEANVGAKLLLDYVAATVDLTIPADDDDYNVPDAARYLNINARTRVTISVELEINDNANATADVDMWAGARLNNETWDKDNKEQARRFTFRNGLNGRRTTITAHVKRTLLPGRYLVQAVFRKTNGSYIPVHTSMIAHG